jgi:hypothetical protein
MSGKRKLCFNKSMEYLCGGKAFCRQCTIQLIIGLPVVRASISRYSNILKRPKYYCMDCAKRLGIDDVRDIKATSI